jgi:hypothetical protein
MTKREQGVAISVLVAWEEQFASVDVRNDAAGLVELGVYVLPVPVGDITLADGLWDQINKTLGTNFEAFEEEEVPAQLVGPMAEVVDRFVAARYSAGDRVRRVYAGRQIRPLEQVVTAAMPRAELSLFLRGFVAYLRDAARHHKAIVVQM